MLLSLGIIGNILVVVWRLTQIRGQRSSPLSILIIMLAVSDLVYCVHLILLESLVVDATSSVDVRQYSISIDRAPNKVCTVSFWLSWFSVSTAQWATFNIAVYSFQAITKCCPGSCCSLHRKNNLVVTIVCQVLFIIACIGVSYFFDGTLIYTLYDRPLVSDSSYDTYSSSYSGPEQIVEIFEYCLWPYPNEFSFCVNGTDSQRHGNHPTITNENHCRNHHINDHDNFSFVREFTVCLNTILILSCAVLLLLVCLKRPKAVSQANITQSDMQWRLNGIVFLHTLCCIPVTVMQWMEFADSRISWANNLNAASVLLISISPAVNPLIYTLTGKNCLHLICKCWRCGISVRQTSSNYRDDHSRGVECCSCTPGVRCVHQDDDYCNTEETCAGNSDQSRLLPTPNDSSETI